MNYLYGYSCMDCKFFKNREREQIVRINGHYYLQNSICAAHLREVWGDQFDELKCEFVCDFFRRINSGAYRRKLKKELSKIEK